jgi:hypothetical protein
VSPERRARLLWHIYAARLVADRDLIVGQPVATAEQLAARTAAATNIDLLLFPQGD